jgi:hypothetical protein
MLIYGGKSICQVKPIPLTEEWLWRFGFANNINGFPEIDLDEKRGLSITFKKTVDTHIVWFAEKDIIEYTEITTLKYVHQLQNLYFALTGKELEIK